MRVDDRVRTTEGFSRYFVFWLQKLLSPFILMSGASTFPGEFNMIHCPEITFEAYVHRIVFYYREENIAPFIISALLLVNFFKTAEPQRKISRHDFSNMHKLFFSSFFIACKLAQDYFYKDSYFGGLFGVEVKELNGLSFLFLNGLKFEIQVPLGHYHDYLSDYFKTAGLFSLPRPLLSSNEENPEDIKRVNVC